jgi:hypothetical protein
LVVEEAADAFDEGLDFPLDRVLVLVAWSCRTHGDAVMFEQVSGGR